MAIEGLELAKACAQAADEIKAENIRVWDLRGLSTLTDFMVVCSGESMPHLRAILREIDREVSEKKGVAPVYAEGKADSRWVVLDYVDVMIHIMDSNMREHYGLEQLWGDAKEVEWQEGKS
jgi:ribosome-associated protein